MHLVLVAVLVAIVSAQVFPDARFNPATEPLPCGFSCSRRTAVTAVIDGVFSRAECSDRNGNIMARCSSCCAMKALSEGLTTDRASGLPSVDGRDCVCCINNNRC
uniref:Bursicon beta subunit n=1 Tax=Haemonchus contortus TaxID=6289 RepID=A0A7I4YLI1_HAECO